MVLSQRLQDGQGLGHRERRELEALLLEQDRVLLGLMNEDPSEAGLRHRRGVLLAQIAQAQGEQDQVLLRLARLVAAVRCPKELQAAWDRVGALLQELDQATVLLAQVMRDVGEQ